MSTSHVDVSGQFQVGNLQEDDRISDGIITQIKKAMHNCSIVVFSDHGVFFFTEEMWNEILIGGGLKEGAENE